MSPKGWRILPAWEARDAGTDTAVVCPFSDGWIDSSVPWAVDHNLALVNELGENLSLHLPRLYMADCWTAENMSQDWWSRERAGVASEHWKKRALVSFKLPIDLKLPVLQLSC